MLGQLAGVGCDREVVVRLAFLVASHKPAAQSELAKDTRRQQRIKRKLWQAGKRLWDAATMLEEAINDARLIFVKPEDIDPLWQLATMCAHDVQTLLWPRAVELPPGHELFTLVSYVTSCSGSQNYALVADLLNVVYEAYQRTPPSQDVISKQVQRSGELKQDLLTDYPGQILP